MTLVTLFNDLVLRYTYNIEVDVRSLVSWATVQRAVLTSLLLPSPMEIIGHDMEVVQNPVEERYRGQHTGETVDSLSK